MFSNRIQKIKSSPTLAAAAKAAELRAKGVDIIDFTTGELIFETPAKIKEACKKALDANLTRYAPVPGLLKLREAISKRIKKDFQIDYSPDEIIVTCGAKQAIYVALQVLINPGDEVIIPAPYWVSYPDQVLLAEGKPVILATDDDAGFKITPQQLERAITPKTKMLILNTPSNPTGACYNKDELKVLGDICARKKIWVLSDEIYDKLTYDNFKHVSFSEACPAWRDRTILINGASKSYSMTGWRMGYAAGPKPLIDKMKILQSQELTSIATFIQEACITAFNDCDAEVEKMRSDMELRRDVMWQEISKIYKVKCSKPHGAFYLFPNMSAFGKPTQELAEYLLEKAHVSVVAGEGFGAPGYLRLSYVCDVETIKRGVAQMKEALGKL
ncbi:MAG: pyridoxal phosphate-dependent aminotransferase [Deltaproteobacteria bacterium]|nr:pyridoxal phosphate-dependent aminotransferase [Deltaproteobacteria bacterium]